VNPNEERFAFYEQLGVAITQWAHVEMLIMEISASCFAPNERRIFSVAFYAVENFRSKMQMAQRIMEEKYSDSQHYPAWDSLAKRALKTSSNRNKLAHMSVCNFLPGKPGRRIALVPWWLSTDVRKKRKTLKGPPPGSLCVKDINGIRMEFVALYAALQNFLYKLHGLQEPHPKSLEQPMNPESIHTLRRQMHEMLGHPLKPSRKKS
jgi:hypothetical protein